MNNHETPTEERRYLRSELSALLSCPFCNGEAEKIPRFQMGYIGDGVKCSKCHIETPKHRTEQSAIDLWNGRTNRTLTKSEAEIIDLAKKHMVFTRNSNLHMGSSMLIKACLKIVDRLMGR